MQKLLRIRHFDGSTLDAPSTLPLPEGKIHLWKAFTGAFSSRINELERFLDRDEISRARRFHFQEDGNRFIVTHGILRNIIGCYMDLSPCRVSLRIASSGKPELDAPKNPEPLFFNISHSCEQAVFAFSRSHRLGVDIERIRPLPDFREILQGHFHPKETAAIHRLPASEQRQAFFQLWTGKEAFVKGTGEGLSRPLDSFTFLPTGIKAEGLLRVKEKGIPAGCWRLLAFSPAVGYAGSLAFAEDLHIRDTYQR